MSVRRLYIKDAADLDRQLEGPPAVFLSASIPYERLVPKGMTSYDRRRFVETNKRYVDAARPVQVRSAVVALTRSLLMRPGRIRLVFGAHPAISPIVLSVAHDVQPEGTEPRILIFQSQYFERELPDSTLHLANWDAGLLVFTPVKRVKGKQREAWRVPSLELMRKLMVSVPNMQGAIFIGGMEGVMAEAEVFQVRNPDKQIIPIPSTGSAAAELWKKHSHRFAAAPRMAEMAQLESPHEKAPSYSLLAEHVLDQLGIK